MLAYYNITKFILLYIYTAPFVVYSILLVKRLVELFFTENIVFIWTYIGPNVLIITIV